MKGAYTTRGFANLLPENVADSSFQDMLSAYLVGDRETALGLIRSMQSVAATVSPDAQCERHYFACMIHLGGSAIQDARECVRQLNLICHETRSKRWTAMALICSAAIENETGHFGYAADLLHRAGQALGNDPHMSDLARLNYHKGVNLSGSGDTEGAGESLEAGLQLARIAGDKYLEAVILNRIGFQRLQAGLYESAAQTFATANEILLSLNAKRKLAQSRFISAVLFTRMGDLEAASLQAEEAGELFFKNASGLPNVRWRQLTAWVSLRAGDSVSAVPVLEETVEAFKRIGSQRDLALSYELLGDAAVMAGDSSLGEQLYREGIRSGRLASARADVVAECLRKSAELNVVSGRLREALRGAREASRITTLYRDRLEIAAIKRVRGLVAVARGRLRYGLGLLFAARAQFEMLPAKIEQDDTDLMIRRVMTEQVRGREPVAKTWPPREREAKSSGNEDGIISRDPRIAQAHVMAKRASVSKLPVLILGETGSGKELLAEAVHRHSGRTGQYLTINCAALPPDILDGELFGSARGAFTGAVRDRAGLIEAANDGTLFLDEVGEMSPAVQGRLLRAIELGEVRRLGENRTRRVNTRFVSATHRDLERMVAAGEFRADLFFRLRGVVIAVPPLRERVGDVDLLVDHFLAATEKGRSIRLTPEARQRLGSHAWPGNVRELKSVIERVVELSSEGATIHPDELGLEPIRIAGSLAEHLEEEERRRVLSTLESLNWNRSRAARALNMKRTTLLTKLKRLGINAPERPKTPPTH